MLILHVLIFCNIPVGETHFHGVPLNYDRSCRDTSASTRHQSELISTIDCTQLATWKSSIRHSNRVLRIEVHSFLLLQNAALSRVKFCTKTCFCSSVIKPCCGGFVLQTFRWGGGKQSKDGDSLFYKSTNHPIPQ
jgi:hypothetical protein